MDAQRSRSAILAAALVLALAATQNAEAASHRTSNFIVTAPTKAFAVEVAEAAEQYRHDLAIEWLGEELPQWQSPCPIRLQVGSHLGAGGATSFMFQNGVPYGWRMNIQGSQERILDSVLPHEVNHTIFATYFGRPLPRWADEGACTTVEAASERAKQDRMLIEFLTTRRGIAFNRMFAMTEYPSDIMPLYAQGYSLARFLIAQGGKRKFVEYVGDGMNSGDWEAATERHYVMKDLSELQITWLDWVRQGSPNIDSTNQAIASSSSPEPTDRAGPSSASPAGRLVPVQLASATTHGEATTSQPPLSPGGSWYAGRRDAPQATETVSETRPTPGNVVAVSSTTRPSANLQWVSPRPAATTSIAQTETPPGDQSTARPQMPQPARLTILEWMHPARPADTPPLPVTRREEQSAPLRR